MVATGSVSPAISTSRSSDKIARFVANVKYSVCTAMPACSAMAFMVVAV
ncbi:Uncharacterised protein [Mycobacteroides abscessus subsp. abscessus]|nr:Uncharacterised protein [Mycobacteroides abscessus subsp. abscessus]